MNRKELTLRVFVLNAFVLPGSGHVYGGRVAVGAALIFFSSSLAFGVIWRLYAIIVPIITSGGLDRFGSILSDLVGDPYFLKFFGTGILSWLVSIADGLRDPGGAR